MPSLRSGDAPLGGALLPPLIAFILARGLLSIAALSVGLAPFTPSTYRRWDSDQYLSIARRGYYLVECARTGYLPYGWCGNTGWMPAYPALLNTLSNVARIPLASAALIASALFEIAALAIAWRLLERRSVTVLFACAFVPGMIYHHAIFPLSMCVFLVLVALDLMLRGGLYQAGIVGALAAMTYSTGFLVAPIAAVYSATVPARLAVRVRRAIASGGLVALGLIAVFCLHRATVGAWDAFLRVQAKYGHGIRLPTVTWIRAISPLWSGVGPFVPAVQATVVGIGIIALTVWRRRVGFRRSDALFLGSAAVFWLVPLVLGGVNLYRADALLVPGLLVLRDAPPWVNGVICVGLATLAFLMAQLFFRGVLV